jgi:hypothetical protein
MKPSLSIQKNITGLQRDAQETILRIKTSVAWAFWFAGAAYPTI